MPYAPDESRLSLAALHHLLTEEGKRLLAQAAEVRQVTPAEIQKLRKLGTADQVHAALITAEVRRKAGGPRGKFPQIADHFFSPPEALEQATSLSVARHKAETFRRLSYHNTMVIVDFCAGIGGDTLGFADIAPTVAVEMSPVRAWCLEQNAAALGLPVQVIQEDLVSLLSTLPERLEKMHPGRQPVFHIDPARRSAGKRSHHYTDLIPGPDVLDKLMTLFPTGMIKLSPGVDFSDLPSGAIELISENRHAVQALLWTGDLSNDIRPNTRVATVIGTEGQAESFYSTPTSPAPIQAPSAYLYEVDPAVHRAGLAPRVAIDLKLAPINTDGGYLTGPELNHSIFLAAAFKHIATVPFRQIRQLLATLPAGTPGPVEVKTRGGLDLDSDQLQKEFSAISPTTCTVMIYRNNDGVIASMASRQNEII